MAAIYSAYESYQADQPVLEQYQQWRSIGRAAARRAIELDPESGIAYASLGSFMVAERRWIQSFEFIMPRSLDVFSPAVDSRDQATQRWRPKALQMAA